MLTYHILCEAGYKVGLAGNVGKSFAWQVAEQEFDYYVIELSSFQLDGMYDFRADVAILLNITPDHLDRYEYKFQNYIDSKFRLLQNAIWLISLQLRKHIIVVNIVVIHILRHDFSVQWGGHRFMLFQRIAIQD